MQTQRQIGPDGPLWAPAARFVLPWRLGARRAPLSRRNRSGVSLQRGSVIAETCASASATPPRAQPAEAAPLRVRDAIGLIVGIVVGAGIFSAPPIVAANAPSAAWMLAAWVIGGLISVAGAMCYAELATAHPNAGGEYHFLKLAFGRTVSFLFAWARITVIPTGSIALLAFVFGDYATQILSLGPYSPALWAALAIAALTALNVAGLEQGKRTQNLLTTLEVLGIAAIVVAGFAAAAGDPAAAPARAAATADASWGLVLVFVMLTYGGWNEAAYVSAELPRRGISRALVWSLVLVTALYLLVNAAYLGALGMVGMRESDAIGADVMRRGVGPIGAQIVSLLIALAALTSANATILMGARMSYAFGRDVPSFAVLGRWRGSAPVNAILVQSGVALLLVVLGAATRQGFETMVEYTAPVFWLFFLLSGASLFVSRARHPDAPRPFRVPLYPAVPLIFCATCAYLLYSSVVYTGIGALFGIAVLACGLPVYLFVRARNPHPRSAPC